MNKKIQDTIDKALGFCRGDEAEVIYSEQKHALTRFTQNYIHQNMANESTEIQVRVIKDGREGSYSTDRLDEEGIKRAVDAALEIAQAQPPGEYFPGLPESRKQLVFEHAAQATEKFTPARRAAMVKKIISSSRRKKAQAAGALSTRTTTLAVSNTSGIRSFQRTTRAEFNFVPSHGKLSGYAFWVGVDVNDLPLEELANEALDKACFPGEPHPLHPGSYTVVLSPYATATLLNLLSYIGFGAKAFLEKRSFMARLKGKKVASEKITIYDDGRDQHGIPAAFDYEGVPKKKVYLIKNGIANDVVYDSRTAAKAERPNTGHALPSPNTIGPMATNLFMAAGRTKSESLVKKVERGLYITKLHYVNVVEPISTVMTGMTKDGTFLIEKGQITSPVRNLRFTQNILKALQNVETVGSERRSLRGSISCITAPALLVKDFHFTGVSGR